jgi:hypothetical protein
MILTRSDIPSGVRFTITLDCLALILPFIGYLSGNYALCLWALNIIVPCIVAQSIYTGLLAFKEWEGRWRCPESAWMLLLSNISCFMLLVLLADWYLKAGWNTIGIFDNLMWSYIHYCASRVFVAFHGYVRKYG